MAKVGTGAAGVNDNLLRSGNSSDLRLLGLPFRVPPEGEVGLDELGDTWVGRWGMGKRKFGLRDDEALLLLVVVDVVAVVELDDRADCFSPAAGLRAGEA